MHSEIDKSKHAFRRRVLDQAFSEKALADAEGLILENARRWLEYLGADTLESGWTRSRDMNDWCNWLSFDLMGDMTFGRDFGCVTKAEHRFIPDVVLNATKFVYVVRSFLTFTSLASTNLKLVIRQAGFWPFISLVRPLFGTKWASLLMPAGNAKENVAYAKYAGSMMDDRLAAEAEKTTNGGEGANGTTDQAHRRKDFVHYLLHTKDPETGQGLSIHELHADSGLLIHAGSDTTAITLSAALFYLLHNPSVLSRLTGLIRSTFPRIESIRSGPELTSCNYLRACIDETMRMATPVPSHLPREVMAGGIEIDGHYFPAGTVVGVAPWTIHHNAQYYPDPFTFNPDRWIVTEGNEESVRIARAAFCPFGIGSRGCAGKRVAYLELNLVLATLLWTYDMKLADADVDVVKKVKGGAKSRHRDLRDRQDVYQIWDHFVADREGPIVRFKKRQN